MSADDFPVLAPSTIVSGRADFVLVVVDRWIVRRILVADGRIGQHPRHEQRTDDCPQVLLQVLGALHSRHRTMYPGLSCPAGHVQGCRRSLTRRHPA